MPRRRAPLWAVALLVCNASAADTALPTPVTGTEARIGPASLIVAEWVRDRFVGFVDCGQHAICMNFFVDARIRRVRTLSGPGIPRAVTVRAVTVYHPRRGARVVMLIQPGRGDEARRGLVIVQDRAGEACVPADQLRGFGIVPPRGSRTIDNAICTRID